MIWLFTSGGQCTRASTSASVLPMNIQSLFPLGLTGLISLLSKGLSRVFSGTTIRKHQFFSIQPSFWSDSHIHTDISMGKTLGKTLTVWSIVGKEMSLLFNTPKSKHLLISWLKSPSAVILESKKLKSVMVSIVYPSICHEVMAPDAMIFVFWMLSFKPAFSLSSFTFINRLFSSPLSAIRVVSSAFLKLLIFLLEILIPACASSSPAFYMMYSVYKLNKQGDNIQPWRTPFPIWNQSVVPCPVLTVASWSAYRFLRRQVRWSGIPISFRIFHSLLWSTQRLWHSQ